MIDRRTAGPIRSLAVLGAIAVVAAGTPSTADVVLVLQDGQEIRGVEVARGELDRDYVLTLSTGAKLTLPEGLVVEVRLSAEGDPDPEAEPRAPSGIVDAEPRELTGSPTDGRTPPLDERLGAFPEGSRSRFRRGPVEPTWRPSSDWSRDTDVTRFNPSRWYRAPIDPSWTPGSAFDASEDVFAGRRSSFPANLIDPSWRPTDGFGRRPPAVRLFEGEPIQATEEDEAP